MNLIPYDIDKIGGRIYRKTKNQAVFEEFIAANLPCCKVEGYPHKSAAVASTTLRKSAEVLGFTQIAVVLRGNNVYFIRKDMEGKKNV